MAERLKVSQLEASVILLNEVFSGTFSRHHNQEVAKALHGSQWREWYHPEDNPYKPEDFLQDSQSSQLLFDAVDQVLETLTFREQKAVSLRFGQENGIIHTLEEIGKEIGLTSRERPRQIIAKSLRKLRHPSRSRSLKNLLPTRETTI